MQLTKADYYNPWYVQGHEVRNIVIFDASGILIDTGSAWLSADKWSSNAIQAIEEITAIRTRRTVDFSREEHFVVNVKGFHTLYLHAGLFLGYSTVQEELFTDDPLYRTWRRAMTISMTINGRKDPDWIKVWEGGDKYRFEETPLGAVARQVAEVYNDKVADHPNRHISGNAALRLIQALPAIQALVNEAKR